MPGCLQPDPPIPAGEHSWVPPLTSSTSQASCSCHLARHREPPEASSQWQPEQGWVATGCSAGIGYSVTGRTVPPPSWVPPQNHPRRGCPRLRNLPQHQRCGPKGFDAGVAPASARWRGSRAERPATSRRGLAWGQPRQNKTRHLCAREAVSRQPGGGGAPWPPPPNSDPNPDAGAAAPAPPPTFLRRGAPRARPHPGLAARQQPAEVSLHAAGNKARPGPASPSAPPTRDRAQRPLQPPHPSTKPIRGPAAPCRAHPATAAVLSSQRWHGQEPPGDKGGDTGKHPLPRTAKPLCSLGVSGKAGASSVPPSPAQLQPSWMDEALPDEPARPRLPVSLGWGQLGGCVCVFGGGVLTFCPGGFEKDTA